MKDQRHVPSETRPVSSAEDDVTQEEQGELEPTTEDLQEPSTEKEPGEQPKSLRKQSEPPPTHKAIGVGVIGASDRESDESTP